MDRDVNAAVNICEEGKRIFLDYLRKILQEEQKSTEDRTDTGSPNQKNPVDSCQKPATLVVGTSRKAGTWRTGQSYWCSKQSSVYQQKPETDS